MSKDKNFLITLSVIFGLLFLFFKIKIFLLISLIFIFFAFIKPNLFHILNYFVFRIGLLFLSLVQPLVLRVIFFLVFGVIGIFMKLFRYDPLKIKIKYSDTFWLDRKKQVDNLEDVKNQF